MILSFEETEKTYMWKLVLVLHSKCRLLLAERLRCQHCQAACFWRYLKEYSLAMYSSLEAKESQDLENVLKGKWVWVLSLSFHWKLNSGHWYEETLHRGFDSFVKRIYFQIKLQRVRGKGTTWSSDGDSLNEFWRKPKVKDWFLQHCGQSCLWAYHWIIEYLFGCYLTMGS